MEKNSGARLFGWNLYPTDKPEPHGYELYLTESLVMAFLGNLKMNEIPGGLYAVLMFKNLYKIGEAWERLWKWVEGNEYECVDRRL